MCGYNPEASDEENFSSWCTCFGHAPTDEAYQEYKEELEFVLDLLVVDEAEQILSDTPPAQN